MRHCKEPAYQGYVFDLDGTIYLSESLIPGARDVIAWLRDWGRAVVFVSNKPLQSAAAYAEKLARLGIPASAQDVINSTQALMHYLRTHHAGERLYVIGELALLTELGEAGFCLTDRLDEIQIVVAAFDRTLAYSKLNIAHQALVRGARFFATNADRTCPVAGGAIPDCAGVIAFLEATTERTVELIAGKPSRHMVEAAVARLDEPAAQCLLVGDRLATDIRMGNAASMDTALVLTGVTTADGLASSEIQPTHVLCSVAQVPHLSRRARS